MVQGKTNLTLRRPSEKYRGDMSNMEGMWQQDFLKLLLQGMNDSAKSNSDLSTMRQMLSNPEELGSMGIPDIIDLLPNALKEEFGYTASQGSQLLYARQMGTFMTGYDQAFIPLPEEVIKEAHARGETPDRMLRVDVHDLPEGTILIEPFHKMYMQKYVADGKDGQPKLFFDKEAQYPLQYWKKVSDRDPGEAIFTGNVTLEQMDEHRDKVPAHRSGLFSQKQNTFRGDGTRRLVDQTSLMTYTEDGKPYKRFILISGQPFDPAEEYKKPTFEKLGDFLSHNYDIDKLLPQYSKIPFLLDPTTSAAFVEEKPELEGVKKTLNDIFGIYDTKTSMVKAAEAGRIAPNMYSPKEQMEVFSQMVSKWRELFGENVALDEVPQDKEKLAEFNQWFEDNVWRSKEMASIRLKYFGYQDTETEKKALVVNHTGELVPMKKGDIGRTYSKKKGWTNSHFDGRSTNYDAANRPLYGKMGPGYLMDSTFVDFIEEHGPKGMGRLDSDPSPIHSALTRWGHEVANYIYAKKAGVGLGSDKSPNNAAAYSITSFYRNFSFGREGLQKGIARYAAGIGGGVVAGAAFLGLTAAVTTGVAPLIAGAVGAGLLTFAGERQGDAWKDEFLANRKEHLHRWELDAQTALAQRYNGVEPPSLKREWNTMVYGLMGYVYAQYKSDTPINADKQSGRRYKTLAYTLAGVGAASAVTAAVAATGFVAMPAALTAGTLLTLGVGSVAAGAASASRGYYLSTKASLGEMGSPLFIDHFYNEASHTPIRLQALKGPADHHNRVAGFSIKRPGHEKAAVAAERQASVVLEKFGISNVVGPNWRKRLEFDVDHYEEEINPKAVRTRAAAESVGAGNFVEREAARAAQATGMVRA